MRRRGAGGWVTRREVLLLTLAVGTAGVLASCAEDPSGSSAAGAQASPDLPYPRGPERPLPPVPAARPGTAQVVDSLPKGTSQVAVTIDDGYDEQTVAAYVRFASDTGIPLTFNPNGCYASVWEPHAAVLRPLIEAQQVQIGNHTFDHKDVRSLSDARIAAQVERNDDWVRTTFGITTRPWFRPPYGYRTPRTDAAVGAAGYTRVLMWNGSFGDSALLTPEVLMAQAQRYLQPGVVMLGHANHPTVTGLYGQILELIRSRNLTPVTLDEVFGTSRATG